MIRKKMSRKTKGMICCLALTALGSIILSEESQAIETNANADVKLKLPYRVPKVIENMEDIDNVGYDVNTTASSTNIHFFGQDLEDNYNKYLMIPDFQFGNINYKGQAVTVPAKELEYKLNNGEEVEGIFSELVESDYPFGMFYVHASPFMNENNKTLKGATINIDYENYNVYKNKLSQNFKLDTLTTTEETILFYPELGNEGGGEGGEANQAPEYEHSRFELNVQDLHVNLNIPGNLSIDDNTTYTSTLTWTASEESLPEIPIEYDGYWGTAPYTFDKDTGELIVYSGELAPVSDSSENGYIGNQIGKSLVKSVRFVGKVVAPTNSSKLFYFWTNMKTFDGTNLDTSKVTDMAGMFHACDIISLDLSNFDTSKVTNMDRMFFLCKNLTSLDLSNFDTSNVTDMTYMFNDCSNLTSLDLSNFDTSNVTSMYSMFSDCSNLTSLDVSNFDTSNVTNMVGMFSNCENLTSLDLSNFDTSNVTNMIKMFNNCKNLTSLDLSNFDTSNVTDMSYMFNDCSNLTSLDLSNFDTSNVTSMRSMFKCENLTSLTLGTKWKWKWNWDGVPPLLGTWQLESNPEIQFNRSDWVDYNGATDSGTYIKIAN